MPPLPADSIHARACKLKCEKILTRPAPTLRILFKTENNKQYLALKVIPPCVVSGF